MMSQHKKYKLLSRKLFDNNILSQMYFWGETCSEIILHFCFYTSKKPLLRKNDNFQFNCKNAEANIYFTKNATGHPISQSI